MPQTQKVVIITGAGRGIGAGIARYLLAQNYKVAIAEINLDYKLHFSELSSRLLFVQTDVKNEKSVEQMILKTVVHFGQIDALINNAAILPTQRISPEKLSLEQWQESIDVNLTGSFLCSKHTIPHLRKSKGAILNIASTRAFQSEPHTEPYSASKGGIVALTHSLAISLAPDIRVNCISPGWIHTESKETLNQKDHLQHSVGRVGKVEDIAAIAAFLLSEQAGFINGQNFTVDGGMTKKMIYEE